VTIGIETTGYTQWFHDLMHRLGHTVLVGEGAKIRAMVVHKTKTDRRDARHLLDLLKQDRFPAVWPMRASWEGVVAPTCASSASSGSWKGKRSVDRGSNSIRAS
jgi:hypothetical protein